MYNIDSKIKKEVVCLKNSLLDSNTYIIQLPENNFIIIDPGDPDISSLKEIIGNPDKVSIKVVLTHEHADHCAGLNNLYEFKKFELFCTRLTGERIADPKFNLTKYFTETGPIEIYIPVSFVTDGEIRNIYGNPFTFIETPGHSPGSTCIFFEEGVFTGDTLMDKTKTPLNMPGSNKGEYRYSLKKLENHLDDGRMVFPGHGEAFVWRNGR